MQDTHALFTALVLRGTVLSQYPIVHLRNAEGASLGFANRLYQVGLDETAGLYLPPNATKRNKPVRQPYESDQAIIDAGWRTEAEPEDARIWGMAYTAWDVLELTMQSGPDLYPEVEHYGSMVAQAKLERDGWHAHATAEEVEKIHTALCAIFEMVYLWVIDGHDSKDVCRRVLDAVSVEPLDGGFFPQVVIDNAGGRGRMTYDTAWAGAKCAERTEA